MLKNNSSEDVAFTEITDLSYDHKSAPGFLCNFFIYFFS